MPIKKERFKICGMLGVFEKQEQSTRKLPVAINKFGDTQSLPSKWMDISLGGHNLWQMLRTNHS
jgi:hypothetical protein